MTLRRAIACALFASVALGGSEIHYGTVTRAVVEARLRMVGKSNAERHDTVRTLFEQVGCTNYLTEQAVKHAKNGNVICTLPGSTDAEIVVGAHFDFIDKGAGAIDNWSGASLLSSLYQGLKSEPHKHTFVFIGFTDEEAGLVGSKFYANHLGKDELHKISAMVNMDSLGTSTTKFEMDRADKRLANALAVIASTLKLPLDVVNVHKVGMSDSDSFQDRKAPTIAVHSVTQQTFPLLHTRGDQLSAMRLDDYYDSYRLLQAYLAYLDELLDR